MQALTVGRLDDPFSVLGAHPAPAAQGSRNRKRTPMTVRAFVPGALRVEVVVGNTVLGELAVDPGGLFSGTLNLPTPEAPASLAACYRLRVAWPGADGAKVVQESADPYAFGVLLGDLDLHLIAEGRHRELGQCLGARVMTVEGIAGVRFAVWAPNASRVSVVGDFNGWDGRRHAMRLRHQAGVWEIFIPQGFGAQAGERYKYEIVSRDGIVLPHRADPVARQTEAPPATASIVADPAEPEWHDAGWLERRAALDLQQAPLSVYEVHVGSWMHNVNDPEQGWDRLAEHLIPYAARLGFTHLELMPVMEHPFGGSWGYQPLAQFAPSARYGSPAAFARFVDRCHVAGLGVILDWVPAHFPNDAHGLAQFDGTALYEYADPREGVHRDWDTLIYNLGRHEVRGFMIASALEWLEHFHVDGLRVDAVASMLYRDYSRAAGEWIPNQYGGRENLESVAFLRELNQIVAERCPGAITLAEESTAWPGVTQAVEHGGLGFSFKWNMGWMHDTLRYMAYQPIHRPWHHNDMSFGAIYAWSEKFILPLSHDEVVHGKGSLLSKMPGDRWQQFANLRAYLGFMWAHPGKKLLFMGSEIAQEHEWTHDGEIDWPALGQPGHLGMQRLVADLNRLLAQTPALYRLDHDPAGFGWVIDDDTHNSVYAFLRRAEAPHEVVLAVCNLTPVPRTSYRIGVPFAGVWQESLNTDAGHYGGSNLGNAGAIEADAVAAHGQPFSLRMTLPPLATLIFRYQAPTDASSASSNAFAPAAPAGESGA
ncbi:1,4-alpha-glucan branching enzyme [Burkholderia sp. WAC0059]|uniref:1,4-alpha-glucan branching protein GlgB n=1 Tax=Burkholderia sp. WAC0059 TaxID=2066022 RepID=UPI000C7E9961|nr:1,4-alpha-glucan branching protein GlgB [Burkholderia sp. WAC0059]PLZ00602.1 1,4-alpha-glucan branching enzyme [Burkholderia sp. WAC0059]